MTQIMNEEANVDIGEMLRYDPLSDAERITGKSYKEDGATSSLGMALAFRSNHKKSEALTRLDDTVFNEKLDNYLRIVQSEGFEVVLKEPFIGGSGHPETYYILFHRKDGVLLSFDTFGTTKINGGKFYYNWKPKNGLDSTSIYKCTSSGGYAKSPSGKREVFVGHHDCKEAFRYKLNRLRDNGELLNPWVERHFLWLLNHSDTTIEGYDSCAITNRRIGLLPKYVQDCILPEGW